MESFEQMGNKMKDILDKGSKSFPFTNLGKVGEHTGKTGRLVGSPYTIAGVLYGDVITSDSEGNRINLTRVKIQQQRNGIMESLVANKEVNIYIPSEDTLTRKNTESMYIYIAPSVPNYQNQAIPANVIGKIDPDSLQRSNTGVCISLRQAQDEFDRRKRQLYERDGLVIVQHPTSIKSPGMVIDPSGKGSMTHFNSNGDQAEFNSQGYNINAKSVDTGNSNLNRSNLAYQGLVGQEHTQVRDLIPTSNIFTPTLSHIPALAKIMFFIGTVRMIINVGKIAKEGLTELRRLQNDIRNLPDGPPEDKTKNDSKEINKLKQKEKLRLLAEALEVSGDSNRANEVKAQLQNIEKVEQDERNIRDQKRTNRQQAFDAIVADAAGSIQGIKNKYLKEGSSKDEEMDKLIPANVGQGYRGQNPQIPVRGAIDETIISNNATRPDELFDPNSRR